MDETPEVVVPDYGAADMANTDGLITGERRSEAEGTVGARQVVVARVRSQHLREVPRSQDEQPIEAVLANGAHPPFGEGVGARRAEGGMHDTRALRGERGINARRERGVAVTEHL